MNKRPRPKALERPQEWHKQQLLRVYDSIKFTRIKCYSVNTCDPEDRRDEYNHHFPRTREGLAKAETLVARGGYDLHEDSIMAHQCKSYVSVKNANANAEQFAKEFQAWCKTWNVKL